MKYLRRQKKENMSQNRYKIVMSPKAKSMFVNNIRFLSFVNAEASKKLAKTIYDGIKELENMPEKFPFIDNSELPKNKYRKKVVNKNYILIYQVINETVYVDYILNCKENLNWFID